MFNLIVITSLLLSLATACQLKSPKSDIELHFGDLPPNPFVIEKSKKENK